MPSWLCATSSPRIGSVIAKDTTGIVEAIR
jgi:hypothetical protein